MGMTCKMMSFPTLLILTCLCLGTEASYAMAMASGRITPSPKPAVPKRLQQAYGYDTLKKAEELPGTTLERTGDVELDQDQRLEETADEQKPTSQWVHDAPRYSQKLDIPSGEYEPKLGDTVAIYGLEPEGQWAHLNGQTRTVTCYSEIQGLWCVRVRLLDGSELALRAGNWEFRAKNRL